MKVELKGKSRHGKNRVNQHGTLWEVKGTSLTHDSRISFATKAPGPWLWLESIDCKCSTCEKWGQDGRWVSERNDDNFEVTIIEENE